MATFPKGYGEIPNLKEAAAMHGNVRQHLSQAIQDAHSGSGYGYYVDHSGDGESGDVVYQSNGKLKKAAYSIGNTDGKMSATVAHDKAKSVTAVTSYKESESDDEPEQSDPSRVAEATRFVEAASFCDRLELREAASALNPMIKIISEGRGSSGYYTKEVLKRDGPKIFKRGTLGYINHATAAEEAARPEGDYSKLALVTTGDAAWDDHGKDGAALYAPAKVFAGVAAEVADKAPHTGVSIRASGYYAESATGKANPKLKLAESKNAPDGRPGLIAQLTHADSIDLVTKAGRDGKLLLESATAPNQSQGDDMDKAEIEALVKEAVKSALAPALAETARLREHLALTKAPGLIKEALKDIRLPAAAKNRIVGRLQESAPLNEAGQIDKVKLTAMVEAEAVIEADFLNELGFGAGAQSFGKKLTEAETITDAAAQSKSDVEAIESLTDIFVGEKRKDDPMREASRKSFIDGRIQ